MNLQVSTRVVDGILAIDLEGKLNAQTSTPALEELLECMDANPDKVLISLSALEFVSSAGLIVILRVAKHVRGYGGDCRVSGAQGMVKKVLEISGFDSLLYLYEDESQAVASFK
jgi:stage II sporulation protein AA (anti-sigma F factor antagonist)